MSSLKTQKWACKVSDSAETLTTSLAAAAELLIANEVVAFPTETVYGLGGNAFSDEAVSKIFAAKGRPSDNPLIVHIADQSQLSDLVSNIPTSAQQLMDKFWPGALTFVLPQAHDTKVSTLCCAGQTTLAVRMPNHPIALALLRASKLPLAAPSANTSTRPSPTNAQHVVQDLEGRIAGVVDGGNSGVGLESTVIDCTTLYDKNDPHVMILRPGGVTFTQLEEVLGQGKVRFDPALWSMTETAQETTEALSPRINDEQDKKIVKGPKAPGMKYKHYAPQAPLYLVSLTSSKSIPELVLAAQADGQRVGVMVCDEDASTVNMADSIQLLGPRNDLNMIAQRLYSCIRSFDSTNVTIIYATVVTSDGLGAAIMNRLGKAAAPT